MKMIPFPDKKYQIIYADPPWDVMRGCDWGSNGASNPLPYPTMSIEQIKNLPVDSLADSSAHLYLWTINKYIRDSYDIAEAWNFKPSCLLTWCKPPHGLGLGGAFTQTTEHLLFCRRGNLKTQKRIDTTWFCHGRARHSQKPLLFMDMVVEVSGDLPRIELFCRAKPLGWDCWGNEV
jgi:N6-adenosine-specific RNA methylase IME4